MSLSRSAGGTAGKGTWARGMGVVLTRRSDSAVPTPGDTALEPAALPPDIRDRSSWYDVRSGGRRVGTLAVCAEHPDPGNASVVTICIEESERGRALGTRALLVAERRLIAEGAAAVWTRVPRDNGRGLYFMLRAGFSPIDRGDVDAGATWFARAGG